MALLTDGSPLLKSKLPGKRMHDDNGGLQEFSTNSKRPRNVPAAPEFSRYSDPVPGFRETGFLKVRNERPGLPVNHSRMSGQNSSFEQKELTNVEERLPNVPDKMADLAKELYNGTLCKQSDFVVSPKTSPRSPTFASKFRPTKIQICEPVPQFSNSRVSTVRIGRTGGPVNPLIISAYKDSCKSKKIENLVQTDRVQVQENVTLLDTLSQRQPLASKFPLPKIQSVVPVARDLPPGCGGRVNSIPSSKSTTITNDTSDVEHIAVVETARKYDRSFKDELDEDGCASGRIERVPLKELAKARAFYAEATKGGNFIPGCSFRDQTDDSRNKVLETLALFDKVYEDALAAKSKGQGKAGEHISTTATRIVKEMINWVNCDDIGVVRGIEIGDQFRFKGQLVLVGLHRQYSAGISYLKKGEKCYATSVVDSDRYDRKTATEPDTIFFSGQGGNPNVSRKNRVEDQKLERGNLALKNSMDAGTPVRVIRKLQVWSAHKTEMAFVYDGLYVVNKCTPKRGKFGKLIYVFELKREARQPRLADCKMSEPRKLKGRNASCLVGDISQGKEEIPIRAFNALDHEKPPPFEYASEMIYPKSCKPLTMLSSSFGCNCFNGCLNSGRCSCVVKNGGKIRFNENGGLVRGKPIVYLCGPCCKCPASCRNRISQSGLRYQFEIFKTESNRWGVRSQNFIAKGSFICEYVGVLRRSKDAKKGTNRNKYVYAIGNEGVRSSYFIDATEFGNISRFINRSHLPNVYAQTVLLDHDEKGMPHVMLFASKNIIPSTELTLDYNYKD